MTPPFFKFTSDTLKESVYQIREKFIEWKLRDRITLNKMSAVCKSAGTVPNQMLLTMGPELGGLDPDDFLTKFRMDVLLVGTP